MAVKMLESLVLRGVAVLEGGRIVNLRLGTSAKAGLQTPVPVIPTRHPVPGCRPNPAPFGWPQDVDYPRQGAMPGAGRSRRHAGVPSPASALRALDATCSTLAASRATDGGSRSAAVMSLTGKPVAGVASVAEGLARWPAKRFVPLAAKGASVGTRGTKAG